MIKSSVRSNAMKKILKTLAFISAVSVFAASSIFAQTAEINIVPGQIVKTYGFADMQNGGQGIAYPKTDNIILIDDATYPKPLAKRKAFTNAIASGKARSSALRDRAAIIILSGTVDLSDGKVTDDDHSYFDEYDSVTHKRIHKDICYEIGANKAIIGVNNARIAFGGLTINGHSDNKKLAKNIIIQNIDFWDSHGSTEYDTKAKGTFTKKGKQYPYISI